MKITLDRSLRRIDADGRLHIEMCHISKATVNPYYGREIPGWQTLGLDGEKVYQMLRPAAELDAAAHTFNNIQLFDLHPQEAIHAENPGNETIIGSTGTDANFDGTYLNNSLVIWDADAIRRIESEEQKELSCGYRYTPDMTPGLYKGLRYDGYMRDIVANHVALVPEGRAGPDVMVADSQLGEKRMKITSKKALMAKGAIVGYVRPLIAADAKLDVDGALQGVTALNFRAKKSAIVNKIAKDAALDEDGKAGLKLVLDAMEAEKADGEDEMEVEDADKEDCEDEDLDDKPSKDKKAKDKKAKDADKDDDGAEDEAEEEPKKTGDDKAKDQKAMDAALAKVRKDTIAEMNAIGVARDEVMPHVGEVAAMDSAADIYKFCLEEAGHDLSGVHPSAYRAMVKMLPDPAAVAPTITRDAAHKASNGLVGKFPHIANIRQSV